MKSKSFVGLLRNEDGSAIILVLMILVLLTVIGIGGSRSTRTEVQIASNEKFHKITFYAAEAARAYVAEKVLLYGPANTTPGVANTHWFPVNYDPADDTTYVQVTAEPAPFTLNDTQSFTGDVEYLDTTDPPRGSGYEAGEFNAVNYQMTCNGFGPRNSQIQIQSVFYRIGPK
jgi:Tfp pilus assembly protein PilX